VVLCGADNLSGGYGLLAADEAPAAGAAPTPAGATAPASGDRAPLTDAFSILLIHEPPASDSPLARLFPLAFAGHTHGGQLRVPARSGLTPLNKKGGEYLAGVHPWGAGLLVVSRGVGTSFLPFRLLTRPEATLWRLVYTSLEH
jgi:predicted MPP superfamily phosphohydrolase